MALTNNAEIIRVRRSPAGNDEYGDPLPAEVIETPLERCGVAPRTSSDVGDRGRQGVLVGLTLYAPFGADLLNTDQVKVDGVLFDVDGEAGQWKSPLTTWEAGCEIALVRAQG